MVFLSLVFVFQPRLEYFRFVIFLIVVVFFFSSHGFLDTLHMFGSCSYPFSSPILKHLMTPGISLLLLLSPCL